MTQGGRSLSVTPVAAVGWSAESDVGAELTMVRYGRSGVWVRARRQHLGNRTSHGVGPAAAPGSGGTERGGGGGVVAEELKEEVNHIVPLSKGGREMAVRSRGSTGHQGHTRDRGDGAPGLADRSSGRVAIPLHRFTPTTGLGLDESPGYGST